MDKATPFDALVAALEHADEVLTYESDKFSPRGGEAMKSPSVKVPTELWCRLCDALCCQPDSPISLVVEKAESLRVIALG